MDFASKQEPPPETPVWTTGLTDNDLRGAMLRAMRLLGVLAVVVTALFFWRAGWQSGLMVMVGAGISTASLWEWLRLSVVINERMDKGGTPRPVGPVIAGFMLRIVLTLAVLYGSLKYLHGTVLALAAGLGLGVVALSVEAFRLMKRWTV